MCCCPDQFDWESNKYSEVQEVCKLTFSKNVFCGFEDTKDNPVEFTLLRVKMENLDGKREWKYTILDENCVDVCDYTGEYFKTFGASFDAFLDFNTSSISKKTRNKR